MDLDIYDKLVVHRRYILLDGSPASGKYSAVVAASIRASEDLHRTIRVEMQVYDHGSDARSMFGHYEACNVRILCFLPTQLMFQCRILAEFDLIGSHRR